MAWMTENNVSTQFNYGKSKELEFAKDAQTELGGDISKSTNYQDRYEHIDLIWENKSLKRPVTFDVKGARKRIRSDSAVSFEYTWLEITNITGKPGSLYGKEDYIAFEDKDSWALVRTKEALDLVLSSITDTTIYSKNPVRLFSGGSECYKKYKRNQNEDVIVLVPMEDIRNITRKIIPKHFDN